MLMLLKCCEDLAIVSAAPPAVLVLFSAHRAACIILHREISEATCTLALRSESILHNRRLEESAIRAFPSGAAAKKFRFVLQHAVILHKDINNTTMLQRLSTSWKVTRLLTILWDSFSTPESPQKNRESVLSQFRFRDSSRPLRFGSPEYRTQSNQFHCFPSTAAEFSFPLLL